MKQITTIEPLVINKTIAKFCHGWNHNVYDEALGAHLPCFTEAWFSYREMQFHKSFDWIMWAVIYIEELEEPHPSNNPERGTIWPYQVEILSRNVVQIIDNRTNEAIVTVEHGECETKFESVLKAVFQFIEIYNRETDN